MVNQPDKDNTTIPPQGDEISHKVMSRTEFARKRWELILEYKVALVKQRVIDSNQHSANCYAPIKIDDAIDDLYNDYLDILRYQL